MVNYVAYDALACEYEDFDTIQEAQDWLLERCEDDGDGISDDILFSFIATVTYKVNYQDKEGLRSVWIEDNKGI